MTVNWEKLTTGTTAADESELRAMMREWPYFAWPALELLEKGYAESGEVRRLRTCIALSVGDREALARVLEPEVDFADFYPDMKPVQLTTNATIDAFLDRYGSRNDKETDLLTGMIFDSSARAGSLLYGNEQQAREERDTAVRERTEEREAEASTAIRKDNSGVTGEAKREATGERERMEIGGDFSESNDNLSASPDAGFRTASRIDAFLSESSQPVRTPEALRYLEEASPAAANTPEQPQAEVPAPHTVAAKTSKTPNLTLSLAAMMIKNRNYGKALQILDELSLADTKKSAIFADQMRFLRKLILIQNQSNQ